MEKNYARQAGNLEGLLKMMPHQIIFAPEFQNIDIEHRMQVSKAMEKLVQRKLSEISTKE